MKSDAEKLFDKINLLEKINTFLSNRKKIVDSTGWPEVTHEELKEFESIISKLISIKWEADADGDYPVEITITDKTMYELLPYFNIRHFHQLKTIEEKLDLLQCMKSNARMAFEDLYQMVDFIVHEEKLRLHKR